MGIFAQPAQKASGSLFNPNEKKSVAPSASKPTIKDISASIWNDLAGVGKSVFGIAEPLGNAVGNSLYGATKAIQTGSFEPIHQAGEENAKNYGKIVGSAIGSAALPVSFALGGGEGATAATRIGSAALKYGLAGGIQGGAQSAASGGNVTDIAKGAGTGAAIGAVGGAAGQGLSEGVSSIASRYNQPATSQIKESVQRHLTSAQQVVDSTPGVDQKALIQQAKTNIIDGLKGEGATRASDAIAQLDTTKFKTLKEFSSAVTQATDKPLQEAIELTKPVLNKKGSIAALERSGTPGGANVGKAGTFEVAPSNRDVQVAESVSDIVSPKNTPIDNIVNINGKIGDVSESQIRPFLQQNPSAFNLKTLNSYVESNTHIPNYIKADPVLQRTYDLTRETMLEEAANHPKTMEGLWDARKSFDLVAERQGVGLDPISDKATVIQQAVLDTRRAVNEFIAENTPNGDQDFKQLMQLLNRMYEARGNIATSNYKELGTSAIQRWIRDNPGKVKALEYGLGAVGIGWLGSHFLK